MMYYRNCEKSISHDAIGEELSPGEVGRPDHRAWPCNRSVNIKHGSFVGECVVLWG